jgi:hypothetical protein
MSSLEAWPPTVASLGGWITLRVTGSSLQEFTQIKPQIVEIYLSSVRSYCVDRNWDTSIFHNDHIRRLLKGAKSLYRSTKRDRPPITLDHLHALTSSPCYTATDSNLRAAYLTAFFGFLRAGEFTWDQRQYADPRIFHATKATRGDVQFAPNFESLTLTLKSSKTDVEHTGVRIIIAASKDPTLCPVWAMRALFQMDPQPPNAPLFNLGAGKAFTKKAFRTAMSKRLLETGYNPPQLDWSQLPSRGRPACLRFGHASPRDSVVGSVVLGRLQALLYSDTTPAPSAPAPATCYGTPIVYH